LSRRCDAKECDDEEEEEEEEGEEEDETKAMRQSRQKE